MQVNWSEFFVGAFGTKKVNDTTPVEIDFHGFHVPMGSVVAELYINGDNVTNIIGDRVTTPAAGFEAGDLITADGDDYFSKIVLSSGAVNLILTD